MRLERAVLEQVAAKVRGALPAHVPGLDVDSRTLPKGWAFLALRGARHDGHAFARAVANQARVLVGEEEGAQRHRWHELSVPQVLVPDSAAALQELARLVRRRWDGLVVFITGSVGKTTTKELLAALLAAHDVPVHATRGNRNNLIGLPLTILEAPDRARVLVLEAGTNARGEIARLTEIAAPDFVVLTAIAPAHLAGLGSLQGVAREKASAFRYLRAGGEIVLAEQAQAALARLGLLPSCVHGPWSVQRKGTKAQLVRGEAQIHWTMPLAADALAADAALALAAAERVLARLGARLDPARAAHALAAWRPLEGRLAPIRTKRGVLIVHDAYNANPASMAAALAALRELPSPRAAVLGEMAELGEAAKKAHQALDLSGLAEVVLIGGLYRELAAATGASWFTKLDEAEGAIRALAHKAKSVLVKGSRAAGMERAVGWLITEAGGAV